jgi:hypothetical protein
MKIKLFALLAIVSSLTQLSIAQPGWLTNNPAVINPNTNYEIEKFNTQQYYDSLHTLNGNNNLVSGEKSFYRWQYFWGGRSSMPGSQPGGDMSVTSLYSSKITSGVISTCHTAPMGYSWKELPLRSNEPDIGVVTAIAIQPNNLDIIYAGTKASGVWKTENRGLTWKCITDNIKLPSFGVACIQIDPNNYNHIFFTAGASDHGVVSSYGDGTLLVLIAFIKNSSLKTTTYWFYDT